MDISAQLKYSTNTRSERSTDTRILAKPKYVFLSIGAITLASCGAKLLKVRPALGFNQNFKENFVSPT